ncbi:MAG: hypothetical protein QOK40_101, partial [Miltoncostaeaceae bacterium]|nr:hypothetical protein [Miltoncostaeaceae bacterium]
MNPRMTRPVLQQHERRVAVWYGALAAMMRWAAADLGGDSAEGTALVRQALTLERAAAKR